jgi:hypothetical protein
LQTAKRPGRTLAFASACSNLLTALEQKAAPWAHQINGGPPCPFLYVGKGKISFKAVGDTAFRDIGNVSSLETTPNLTTLEHFSSREGVKNKDKEVVTEKKMTVTMVMDEWTAENLAMALLGDISTDVDGNKVIDIFSRNSFEGELKYEGTADGHRPVPGGVQARQKPQPALGRVGQHRG